MGVTLQTHLIGGLNAGIVSGSSSSALAVPATKPGFQTNVLADSQRLMGTPSMAMGVFRPDFAIHELASNSQGISPQILSQLSQMTPGVRQDFLAGLAQVVARHPELAVTIPELTQVLSQLSTTSSNPSSSSVSMSEMIHVLAQVSGLPVERVLVMTGVLTHEGPQVAAQKYPQAPAPAVLRTMTLLQSLPVGPEKAVLLLLTQTQAHTVSQGTEKTLPELARLFERVFLKLPESARAEVLLRLLTSSDPISFKSFERVVMQVAKELRRQELFGGTAANSDVEHTPGFVAKDVARPILSESDVQHLPTTTRQTGSGQSTMTPKAPTAQELKQEAELRLRQVLGPALYEFISTLPAKQAVTLKPLLYRVANEQATPEHVERLLAQLKPMLENPKGQVLDKILNSWSHPSWQVKLLVVRVLKQLAAPKAAIRPAQAMGEDGVIPLELKYLARSQDSSEEVRSEAIRVALEMGDRQRRQRQEMEDLLRELEVVSTLKELFASRRVDLMREGLRILALAWGWFQPDVRADFESIALRIAQRSRPEELSLMALDLLLTNVRDLSDGSRRALMGKDLYNRILISMEQSYRSGRSNFTKTPEGDVVPLAMKRVTEKPVAPQVMRRAA